MQTRNERVTVRLPKTTKVKLQTIAHKNGISLSDYLNMLLKQHIEDGEPLQVVR